MLWYISSEAYASDDHMKPDCVSLGSVVLGSKLANAGWGQLGRL